MPGGLTETGWQDVLQMCICQTKRHQETGPLPRVLQVSILKFVSLVCLDGLGVLGRVKIWKWAGKCKSVRNGKKRNIKRQICILALLRWPGVKLDTGIAAE